MTMQSTAQTVTEKKNYVQLQHEAVSRRRSTNH